MDRMVTVTNKLGRNREYVRNGVSGKIFPSLAPRLWRSNCSSKVQRNQNMRLDIFWVQTRALNIYENISGVTTEFGFQTHHFCLEMLFSCNPNDNMEGYTLSSCHWCSSTGWTIFRVKKLFPTLFLILLSGINLCHLKLHDSKLTKAKKRERNHDEDKRSVSEEHLTFKNVYSARKAKKNLFFMKLQHLMQTKISGKWSQS